MKQTANLRKKRLHNMVRQVGLNADNVPVDLEITGVTHDSRQVLPGYIFVALQGSNRDGRTYIPQAIDKGAVAIVGIEKTVDLQVPYIHSNEPRKTLADLSAAFYDFPAERLTVIGVTGTDGKTTTSNMIYRILQHAGYKTGLISTVNAVIGNRILDTGFHVTTPEAPDVQRYLSEMVSAGLTHVVLETTSHGLAQQRVADCQFDIAVVTNIQHEHLDYHKTFQAYQKAKGILFSALAETKDKRIGNIRLAVLNRDDRSYAYLSELIAHDVGKGVVKQVTYGIQNKADYMADDLKSGQDGMDFVLKIAESGLRKHVHLGMLGEYNVYNALAAIAASVAGLGITPDVVLGGFANMGGIPGRMEVIDLGQPFNVIVDFAHTPNALRQALKSARKLTNGKLIAVFGSAGLRDREKRRIMAEVSTSLADLSVFTAEDPRIESLDEILAMMAEGAIRTGGVENQTFVRITDRGDAIRFALRQAKAGDIVIVCGKGHEQSMCFGDTEYLWDDRLAVRAALAEMLNIQGPAMPKLPTSKD